MKNLLAGCVAIVGVIFASASNAATINFEGAPYTNGYDLIFNSPGLPTAGSANTYSVSGNNLGTDTGIVYDTTNTNNLDPDQDAPFTDIDTNSSIDPGNIAVIGNGNVNQVDDTNNVGTLNFIFSSVVNISSFRVFDVGDNSGALTVQYFDINGNSIGLHSSVGSGTSDRTTQLITLSALNVKRAAFTFGGSGGIDDISFSAVPLPAALPLFGTGLALMGFFGRRRKRAAAA